MVLPVTKSGATVVVHLIWPSVDAVENGIVILSPTCKFFAMPRPPALCNAPVVVDELSVVALVFRVLVAVMVVPVIAAAVVPPIGTALMLVNPEPIEPEASAPTLVSDDVTMVLPSVVPERTVVPPIW